jgi:hypothetical protein
MVRGAFRARRSRGDVNTGRESKSGDYCRFEFDPNAPMSRDCHVVDSVCRPLVGSATAEGLET